MDQILDGAVGSQRFTVALLTVFGLMALFLSVVGVYGVVSYTVSQRTREIGLRKALGAENRRVMTRVMWEGLILSLFGVAVGLVGSLLLSRAFESMVFGVTPTDPATYGSVGMVLVAAAALASLAPAWRASRIDPVAALRED
jgi:ABC-type antimicrobial peptide transport system permease subunit